LHSVMSNLLVATMLLHAVLGCCLHHSHAEEDGNVTPQVSMSQASSPCHEHGRGCGPSGSHQHDGDPCHEAKFVFVRPPQEDQDAEATSLGAVDTVFPAVEANCLGQTRSSAMRNVASTCDLPVRSHLAKQVLLI
jgi:hypothetical protein